MNRDRPDRAEIEIYGYGLAIALRSRIGDETVLFETSERAADDQHVVLSDVVLAGHAHFAAAADARTEEGLVRCTECDASRGTAARARRVVDGCGIRRLVELCEIGALHPDRADAAGGEHRIDDCTFYDIFELDDVAAGAGLIAAVVLFIADEFDGHAGLDACETLTEALSRRHVAMGLAGRGPGHALLLDAELVAVAETPVLALLVDLALLHRRHGGRAAAHGSGGGRRGGGPREGGPRGQNRTSQGDE